MRKTTLLLSLIAAFTLNAQQISTFPYVESFESGNGNWFVTGTSSWALGVPAGVVIDTASDGTEAWVTNLTGDYGFNETGFVNSPSFDFTNVVSPFIELDISYDTEGNWDGATMQSSIDSGITWQIVGAFGDPANWYSNGGVDALLSIEPSEDGWSGLLGPFWVRAKHYLHRLGGKSDVRLRIAFASDNNNNYEGMAFDNISIYDGPIPYLAITEINKEDTNGVATMLDVYCWSSGTVMGVDLDGNNGISFYVTDLTVYPREGINVFNFNDVSNYVVNEGDSISIRGVVDQYNGLTELVVDSISIISTSSRLPIPLVVTNLNESNEAKLIQLNNLVVITGSGSGSYNMSVSTGIDTLTMRVDADTDVNDSLDLAALLPGDTICSVVGIGAQFDFSSPYKDGYQIFPMRFSDMDTVSCQTTGIKTVEATANIFSIAPNPTSGQFVIRTSGFNSATVQIQIRDLNGRIVRNESINVANNAFQQTFDLNGNAKGIYFISIFDGNDVVNEKLILR